ncbi:hypothetical protein QWY31_03485 [Cytophagales bacterium LB-30]|uniref:Uncharacterized protein n=1 Tax=Shiella aurantiaca TaxID=3058365 RepID=A0ABT8F267_9BACT|nr:hypothetical protein [Shiella aurantiaca]MDN4164547.1 hypothetical protein [Shiella aurantiaca]
MKYTNVLALFLVLLLFGCVVEDDRTPPCTKWEVQINNPEASVKIENGKLIVDIPNPTSFTDVRLVQVQQNELHAVVGAWFNGTIEAQSSNEEKAYAEMRFSFAYQANIPNSFVGMAVTSEGALKGYVDDKRVYSARGGNYFFYAEGTSAVFETNHELNPQAISPISASSKVFYIDFGVDPAISHFNPIASLHAELDFVKFGDRVLTPFDESQMKEKDKKGLGFVWDDFECNSLKD